MVELELNGLLYHESRQSSVRAEEAAAEDTPLLARFPRPQAPRNPMTTAVVSTLLIILISGIIIGIYLLILQSQAENILPPVEAPLKLASLHQWDPSEGASLSQPPAPFRTSQVIIVQTDTNSCYTVKTCEKILLDMKNTTGENKSLPYNFLISSDGQTYEALGWHSPSPLFPGPASKSALVVAFIGNFTESQPSDTQIAEGKIFLVDSVSRQHLDPNFIIVGRKTKYFPKYLFSNFKDMSQWSDELSDSS